jgi:hypothetical protein
MHIGTSARRRFFFCFFAELLARRVLRAKMDEELCCGFRARGIAL